MKAMDSPGQTHSLLIVDDEPDICANLSDIFSDLGYHVDTASDGLAALEQLKSRQYDVALIDLRMPGMNGLELCRRIRAMRCSTVPIIVTAFASTTAAAQALREGAWQILGKPVNPALLLQLVEQAIDQPLIMVIDDDPDLCDNLRDLLREQGFRVASAQSAEEAAQQVRVIRPQVVLIDLKFPQGDGYAVFRLVREAVPCSRTILITGHRHEMNPLIEQALADGADAVCYKPFDIPELLNTVQRFAPAK
jgi:CheY-like chemotaxis protein